MMAWFSLVWSWDVSIRWCLFNVACCSFFGMCEDRSIDPARLLLLLLDGSMDGTIRIDRSIDGTIIIRWDRSHEEATGAVAHAYNQ